LSESRALLEKAVGESGQLEARMRRERKELEDSYRELQQAFSDLQTDRSNLAASVSELEAERTAHRRAVGQYEERLESLRISSAEREAEFDNLQALLAESQGAEAELKGLLEQNQTELENLRGDAAAKEERIHRLNDQLGIVTSTPPTPSSVVDGGELRHHRLRESLGGEMLSAVQQQHVLELSAARSQARSLENTVHTHETRTHALQRQVAQLETELATLRATSFAGRPLPLASPSARLSRTFSSQSIASSNGIGGGGAASERSRPPRLAFGPTTASSRLLNEAAFSPDTRHKRKVSLSMLKARIESERLGVAAASAAASSLTSPAPFLAPLEEVSPTGTPEVRKNVALAQENGQHGHHYHEHDHPSTVVPERSQFRDETHVFWCHACSGDLVVL
jgi:predicted  nucleic acid-binding Zn-ribbon protein